MVARSSDDASTAAASGDAAESSYDGASKGVEKLHQHGRRR
jgi:hypothetical protein